MTFKNFQVIIRCFRRWPFVVFGCFLSCGIFLCFKFSFFKFIFLFSTLCLWHMKTVYSFFKKCMASCLGEENVPSSWILDIVCYILS